MSARHIQSKRPALGFTLIELLVAISIVAILAAIGMVTYSGVQANARDTVRKQDLKAIKEALYLHKNISGSFAPNSGDGPWGATITNQEFQSAIVTSGYLKSLPKDPKASNLGYYLYVYNRDRFAIYTQLEKPGGANVSLGCDPAAIPGGPSGYNYCITQD